ncbi:hypothetical protein, partial [Acidithiobacillus ferrooxidans]
RAAMLVFAGFVISDCGALLSSAPLRMQACPGRRSILVAERSHFGDLDIPKSIASTARLSAKSIENQF